MQELHDGAVTACALVKFVSVPPENKLNRAPAVGQQFFGIAKIDRPTRVMRVSLHDLEGKELCTR